MAGVGIEQFALHAGAQQVLVFVLAVNIHQQAAEFAQGGEVDHAAIDVGAAGTFARNYAAQQAVAGFVVQVELLEFGLCIGAVFQAEQGFEFGAVASGADGFGSGAITQQ